MRAFDLAAKQHWAILSQHGAEGDVEAPHLKRILDIAARAHEPDFEAVVQKLADRTDEAGVLEMRGSVAVVNVVGPIFRYANLFTWISGATSVQDLATAFRTAVDDPAVKAIVLNIDSPGGEVAGIAELATAIFEARKAKPIIAYADDLTASGAYWIASAASRMVTSETAELGSVGVVATIVKRAEPNGSKTYQFVSSVSPGKRPDLETDEGRAAIQQRVDDLAAVFVGAVARNRGVSQAKVLADFGRGGVLIASKAIAAGMADEIGTFEGVLAALETGMVRPGAALHTSANSMIFGADSAAEHNEGGTMDPNAAAERKPAAQPKPDSELAAAPKTEPVDIAAIQAAATKTERARIAAILNADEAKGRETLARSLVLDTDLSPEAARKVLAASPATTANPLAGAMAGVANPRVGADSASTSDEASEISAILAFVPKKGGK